MKHVERQNLIAYSFKLSWSDLFSPREESENFTHYRALLLLSLPWLLEIGHKVITSGKNNFSHFHRPLLPSTTISFLN